ncbi:MAG: Zn-dependent hydrolase [Gemmatimonadota bacterium]|nr:Zn-dependent hydrolase [Gemmatimonadota bacterium]
MNQRANPSSILCTLLFCSLAACTAQSESAATADTGAANTAGQPPVTVSQRMAKYTPVTLVADTSALSVKERQMLPLLIDAARAMDEVFWREAYGDKAKLLSSITDADTRRFVETNYGPWDRLDNNAPFVPGVGPKPQGAGYYPTDMAKAEFEAAVAAGGARADSLKSLYTIIQRNQSRGLEIIPFHRAFAAQHQLAASKLREAAALAEDPGLRRYLELRASALLTDNYQESDLAWMDMKNNNLDIVIGPIETYEDALFGYKATHEGFVLIKDKEWSSRLAKYSGMLPALQRGIPVAEQFKREKPAAGSDLNAYDVVFVAGDANSGSKTIAINLPNDEEVQLKKGTRRLQLKNAMRAKFDKILLPIARELIVDDQVARVTFDSFFENVMFHEVAHGLGIKNTINNTGPVRTALKERYSSLEEGKADILGLYMIRQLSAQNETATPSMDDNYITFIAGLFRSVRFGAASAHGRANVAAFNFLERVGAFTREPSGKYRVNAEKMREGVDALSRRILELQGNGDYAGAGAFGDELGKIGTTLQADLDRLGSRSIPVDIIYEQAR